MRKIVSTVRSWYGKYERPISSLSLISGFVFDAVALKEVGEFWENIFVLAHIVGVAICMIWIHKVQANPGDEADPEKLHFWLVNALQFIMGGLLSVFLVFYFRSSDLSASWPFLLILALAFWANESLKRQFVRATFQVSLFFLSVFLTAIYQVPLLMHQIGPGPFILSGLLSLFVMHLFLTILYRADKKKFEKSRTGIVISIGCIFIGMNMLYFTNLIPPIPLSLKDSGIFHSLERRGGEYVALYEDAGWRAYIQLHDDFHSIQGEAVYAYTSIFLPSELRTPIVHLWQYYDEVKEAWVNFSTVGLSLTGGREGGFRTFSMQEGLASGKWRVNVLTESGQVIGRLRFTVIPVSTPPTLTTKILD